MIKKYPLASFFFLAYLITWVIALPLILKSRGMDLGVPYALHYLTAFGPMLAAIIVIGATEGKEGLKKYFHRFLQIKDVSGIAWLGAFSLFLIFAGIIVFQILSGKNVDINSVGDINFLPNVGVASLLIWIFTSGIGEEGGWRGFALPKLQSKYNALASSIILAIFWAGWHAFAFFYIPNYQRMGLMVIGFFLGLACGSIVFTWLLNSSRGSLVPVVLFHGFLNFTSGSRLSDDLIAPVISMFIMVLAVILVIAFKPENLSKINRFRS